ncbi:MAG: choice-of-anchor P family protein [Gammaproteobacteria bacterium]
MIEADTSARCTASGRASVDGDSIIENLRINNRLVSSQAAFPPNTVVKVPEVPGVKLVANGRTRPPGATWEKSTSPHCV